MFKTYIQFIKPGYIIGTGLTTLSGFFLASKGHINFPQLFGFILGIAFGLASVCVFNNVIDMGIDGKMERTRKRALVTGIISKKTAILLGIILGIFGVGLMAMFSNVITLFEGALGVFFYEMLYPYFKRHSWWSTIVGSVAGAMPPVAGYTAVMGKLDSAALLLFLLFAFWQMPHFYSIAIYRREDYKKAGLPVLPVIKGLLATKIQILFFTVAFAISSLALSLQGYTGKIYFFVVLTLSAIWIMYAGWGFFAKNSNYWARRMFFFSLIVNFGISILLICNSILV